MALLAAALSTRQCKVGPNFYDDVLADLWIAA
jgi:hypothetical protein